LVFTHQELRIYDYQYGEVLGKRITKHEILSLDPFSIAAFVIA
jgi:hypothetical protein